MKKAIAMVCLCSFSWSALATGAAPGEGKRQSVIFAKVIDGIGRIVVAKGTGQSGHLDSVSVKVTFVSGETEDILVDLASQKVRAFDLEFTPDWRLGVRGGVGGFWIEGHGMRGYVNTSEEGVSDDSSFANELLRGARVHERAARFARLLEHVSRLDAGRTPLMACAVAAIAGVIGIASIWGLTGACAAATGGACLAAIGSAVSGTILLSAQIGDSCG